MKKINHIKSAKKTLLIESRGLVKLSNSLSNNFSEICDRLMQCKGRIITLGVGKSGHIGNKVAATLSSTGSPAHFINAGEALHGDIGAVKKEDIILIFSHSGQSKEIIDILPFIKAKDNIIFSITGNKDSIIAIESDINISTDVDQEACPLDLTPTASTTASLALGDAIAVALRTSSPIYVSDEVMDRASVDKISDGNEVAEPVSSEELTKEASEEIVLENLNEALEKAITEEEYEVAARLRDRIKQLEKKSTS